MSEIPLIWTNKGNLPIADLEHHVEWFDDEHNVTFIEVYRLAGEIVKQSVHIMAKHGVFSEGVASID